MSLMQSNFHRSTLTAANLIAADTAVSATTYTELGRYTIPAGVGAAVGFSSMEGQNSAPGRAYANIMDNGVAPGAAIEGTFRIDVHDPEDHVLRTILEAHTSRLRTTAGDPATQLPLPVNPPGYGQDYTIVAMFRADVAGKTVGKINSSLMIDVTRYTVRQA